MRKDVSDEEMAEKLGSDYVGRYVDEDAYRIDFDGDMTLTYEAMRTLSEIFKTRAINVVFDGGWIGTDVTPGDPARFFVVIGRATDREEEV